MSAFGGGGGTQGPAFGPRGPVLTTVNLLRDPGNVLSLQENFAAGVGKAHRQVVFAHGEFRNYRTHMGNRGAVIR